MLAMAIGPTEALVFLWLISIVVALYVSAMKGQWLWFALGVVFMLPAYVGAVLPARPGSAWARRRDARSG